MLEKTKPWMQQLLPCIFLSCHFHSQCHISFQIANISEQKLHLFLALTGCLALMITTAINNSEDPMFWLYLKDPQISQCMKTHSWDIQNIN